MKLNLFALLLFKPDCDCVEVDDTPPCGWGVSDLVLDDDGILDPMFDGTSLRFKFIASFGRGFFI